MKRLRLKSLSSDCWHGNIYATWKSSLKDSISIKEEEESEEHDEDLRFWRNWRRREEPGGRKRIVCTGIERTRWRIPRKKTGPAEQRRKKGPSEHRKSSFNYSISTWIFSHQILITHNSSFKNSNFTFKIKFQSLKILVCYIVLQTWQLTKIF